MWKKKKIDDNNNNNNKYNPLSRFTTATTILPLPILLLLSCYVYLPGDEAAAAAAAADAAEEDVGGEWDGGERDTGPAAAGGGDSDPLDSAPLSDALELIPSVSWKQTKHVLTIIFLLYTNARYGAIFVSCFDEKNEKDKHDTMHKRTKTIHKS